MKNILELRKYQSLMILGFSFVACTLMLALGSQPSRALSPTINVGVPDQSNSPSAQQRDFIILPDVENISVQNLLPATASITATFSLENGTPISTVLDTLPAESFSVYTSVNNAVTGGVEATTSAPGYLSPLPIFATNFVLSEAGNSAYLGIRLENYQLFQSRLGETTNSLFPVTYDSFIPYVIRSDNNWNTEFTLFNYGLFTGNFVIYFYDRTGTAYIGPMETINPNESRVIDVAGVLGLPTDIFSVVIASDQPVFTASSVRISNAAAGIRSEYQAIPTYQMSDIFVAPALYKGFEVQPGEFMTSQICVQNTDFQTQKISIAYSDNLISSEFIPPGALQCFDQGIEGHGDSWFGGAVITGETLIAAMVNVNGYNMNGELVGQWAYSLPSSSQVSAGALATPFLLNNFNQFDTSVHLYNYGTTPATVTPRFVSADGFTYCPTAFTIPANAVRSISQADLPAFMDLSMGYFRSTQPLAAAVSANSSKPQTDTDQYFGYEAGYLETQLVPQDPCDTIYGLYLPLIER